MISLHTFQKISAATLVSRCAKIKQHRSPSVGSFVSVEFPATKDVGSISGTWEIEETDIEFLTLWYTMHKN